MIALLKSETQRRSLSQELTSTNRRCQFLNQRISRVFASRRSNPNLIRSSFRLLEQYRDELAWQFSLEMASRSFRGAISKAPRLHDRVLQLVQQQETLYIEICEIADALTQESGRLPRRIPPYLPVRWELFNKQLQRHQVALRELTYEANFVDLGVGD
jgi:hypothetical protein